MDSVSRPIKIYHHSKVVVVIANNRRSGSGSRFVNLKFLSLKDRVKDGQVSVEYINRKKMLADLLTKGIKLKDFVLHIPYMELKPLLD